LNFSVCISCGRAAACQRPGCPIKRSTQLVGLHRAMTSHLPADALMILPVGGTDPWVGIDDRDWRDSLEEPLDLRPI